MGAESESTALTKKKRVLFTLVYVFFLFTLLFGGGEVIIRLKGYTPWEAVPPNIKVNPGGKYFQTHPVLGYTHLPGEFDVTLHGSYTFTTTHDANGYRVTSHQTDLSSEKQEIWVFGCSYTHGWSVNDEETYVWLLQEAFPEVRFRNFGVSGYGTVHSLLQLLDELERATPKMVILAYAEFHDERNVFLRNRRKAVAPWNTLGPLIQPYGVLDDHVLNIRRADVLYSEFPLMRQSALAHFLEIHYNEFEAKQSESQVVSRLLVQDMSKVVKEHGSMFLIANISG